MPSEGAPLFCVLAMGIAEGFMSIITAAAYGPSDTGVSKRPSRRPKPSFPKPALIGAGQTRIKKPRPGQVACRYLKSLHKPAWA